MSSWAVSSVRSERLAYTEEVGGSSPPPPTTPGSWDPPDPARDSGSSSSPGPAGRPPGGWGPPSDRPRIWPWLVIGGVIVAVIVAGLIAFAIAQPRIAGEFVGALDPARTPIEDAAIGACFEGTQAEGEDTIIAFGVREVDCVDPHAGEVIGHFVLQGAIAEERLYPGDTALSVEAERACRETFRSYVGIDYDASELEIQFYFPLSRAWLLGDRKVDCAVFGPAGKSLEGSVRGSRR
jgi:Septum formation